MSAEPMAVLRSLHGQTIPLKSVDLSARAEGLLFELTVEQRYANAESETIEAIYTFPLPLNAVLLSFELEIGARRLKGTVSAKREASERYEQAIEGGDAAALLEQAASGLYTVNLGNLKPGETAVIRYRYAELLAFEQGRLRIAVPTVVAPRYGVADLEPHQVPEADITARYPCTLRMELVGALAHARIESPSHARALRIEAGASLTQVSTARTFSLDRDLVILLDGLAATSQAVVARDGDGYVTIVSAIAPKSTIAGSRPRALKLVVDCSGSMQGDSIAQARAALLAVMHGLHERDRVSLTRFGSTVQHVTRTLEPATHATLTRLSGSIRTIEADLGGTEMRTALDSVTRIPVGGEPADLLLITDGEIWEVEQTVEAIAKAKHRLFVVAVGAAPNEVLARRIADVTGGACEFVTPNEDVRAAVARLLARMGTPAVRVEGVVFPQPPEWVHGADATAFPGDTFHVFAGLHDLPRGSVELRLDHGRLTCELPDSVDSHDTLARVAAMTRLKTLPHAQAAALAERYQLVTEYTSCVVVLERAEGEKADGMPALRTVPQELAAGWGGMGRVPDGVSLSVAAPAMRVVRRMQVADESARAPNAHYRESMPIDAAFHVDDEDAPIGEFIAKQRYADIATALRERVTGGGTLPTTFDELRALGVSEEDIAKLGALALDGHGEAELVVAWLAWVVETHFADEVPWRLRFRLKRASDRELRRTIAERQAASFA